MALLEKDGNRPGGPNFFEIRKGLGEFAALREVDRAAAGSLATPMTVDKPGEALLPETLVRQKNR